MAQHNETTAMCMAMSDDDVYYTYAGARKALPEGWKLPTLGELDAVVKNLGGYDVVGDKMKRAGDSPSFIDKNRSLPDSLQLRIEPKGYIKEDGQLDELMSGYIMTDTRENHQTICMKISYGLKKGIITIEENGKNSDFTTMLIIKQLEHAPESRICDRRSSWWISLKSRG